MEQNFIFIISAASGVGKSTLYKKLLSNYADAAISISYTTRKIRDGEIAGRDYYFVSNEEFDNMVSAGAFIEHANVYGNQYGTAIKEIERLLKNGLNPVLEVDWQGAMQIREKMKDKNIISVYILPPSVHVVYERLRERNTDDDFVIEKRMKSFFKDIEHYEEYDFVIVNDNLEEAFKNLCSIYETGRIKLQKRTKMKDLYNKLLQEKGA